MKRALVLCLLFPCMALAQSAASSGRYATLRISGAIYSSSMTGTATSGLTLTSSAAATGSQDTAFTLNASNALSQSAAVDSLIDVNNSGTTVFRFWSSARLLMKSQASNQAPGFNIQAGSAADVYFRLAGGSGENVQMFANNTTTSLWQIGGCPATNCAMWFGPGSNTSEAASELIIYKGTSGPAVKLNVPIRHGSYTLPTCASGTEGTISFDAASGGTTTHRTRMCLCTSDGAASPVYKWQNIVSATLGTTTTCAD